MKKFKGTVYRFDGKTWQRLPQSELAVKDIIVEINQEEISIPCGESREYGDKIFKNKGGFLEVEYLKEEYILYHGPLHDHGC